MSLRKMVILQMAPFANNPGVAVDRSLPIFYPDSGREKLVTIHWSTLISSLFGEKISKYTAL